MKQILGRSRTAALVALTASLIAVPALAGCSDSSASGGGSASASPAKCDPAKASPPGTTEQSVTINGVSRSYLLHVPSSYSGRDPLPLLMTFHGRGQSGRGQLSLTALDQQSNQLGYLLIAPNAVNGEWALPSTPGQSTADTKFVSAILDKTASTLCVNTERTYASGMSLGSAMTFVLACAKDRRFAAFGGVGASFYRTGCDASPPAPIIYFHGTADPVVPSAGGKVNSTGGGSLTRTVEPAQTNMKNWATHNKCAATPTQKKISEVTQFTWSGCSANADVIFYKIAGGGHTWPGTDPTIAGFTEGFLGKTTQAVKANELMWEFFSQYTLTAPTG